jgi:hypothetical protein
MTRAEAQTKANHDFAFGRITLDEWRKVTDELSNPHKWLASGRLREAPKEER